MTTIALITDSTSDMNTEAQADVNVSVVPLNVHFGSKTYLDFVDISPDEFLTKLAASSDMPRTSQPSPAAFSAAFDAALEHADQILVVSLSSKLSGTYQSACLGAVASGADRIVIVDSLSASVGLQLQVRRARALIDSGMAIEAIAAQLERERSRYHLLFFADTLDYLQRGGRIGKANHLVGSLLKIKPILMCVDGEVQAFERTRSRGKAIEGLLTYARSLPSIGAMSILHDGNEYEDIDYLLQALSDRIDPATVIINRYGPIVATHVGPGALGLCLFEAE